MAKCKICSKPSGYFPLCKSCSKLKEEGKITKCETCGVYHYSNDKCECEKTIGGGRTTS